MRVASLVLAPLLPVALACAEGNVPAVLGTLDAEVAPGDDDVRGTEGDRDVSLADGQICRPGEMRCMGSVLLWCRDDGTDWDSAECPPGTECKPAGCVVLMDALAGFEAVTPSPDVVGPGDDVVAPVDATPADMGAPDASQDVSPPKDVIQPPDGTTQPPDVTPPGCGNGPPCLKGQECCESPNGDYCAPAGHCGGQHVSCMKTSDCPEGLKCCPSGPPGSPGECREQCGGVNIPSCESDADCIGGQSCVGAMGYHICVSECASDEDCGGGTCQEIGGFGYVIAKVCDCAGPDDCAVGLTCCEIPYVGGQTCLTECINF